MKKKIGLVLRIVASISLLAFVLTKVPFSDLGQTLKHSDWRWLAVILIIAELSMWQQSVRWHRLVIGVPGEKPSIGVFFRFTAIGAFFNLLLPTGFGGDAVKSISLGRKYQMMGRSVASVMIARILGLLALVISFWIAVPFVPWEKMSSHWLLVMAGGGSAIMAVGFILVGSARLSLFANWVDRFRTLRDIRTSIAAYSGQGSLLAKSFLDSFLIQLLIVGSQWIMFRCVGVDLPFFHVLVVFPIVTVVTMLPVSIYGIGVRELVSLSLYGSLSGLAQDEILAASLLGYLVVLLQAFQGAMFYAIGLRAERLVRSQ